MSARPQPGVVDEFQNWLKKLPPVTRALFGASVITPFALMVSPALVRYMILTPSEMSQMLWQPWRILANFFIARVSIVWLSNIFFLYQYSNQVETQVFNNKPADYIFFLLFVMLASDIVGIVFNMVMLPGALRLAIVYLWANLNAEQTVKFMFGAQFQAKFLPWVLIVFEMIQKQGNFPIDAFIGVLVGHLYYYADKVYPSMNGGRVLISTPSWLRSLFPDPPPPAGNVPGLKRSAGPSSSSSSGSSSGHSWGKGHRLG